MRSTCARAIVPCAFEIANCRFSGMKSSAAVKFAFISPDAV